MRTSRTRWFYCTNSINHKVSYLKKLQQFVFWKYRSYLKWYYMLIQASTGSNWIPNYVVIKNVYFSLNWFNIRDDCLLFLVLHTFMVFIMHELDHCKNLLQKYTVTQYCCTALVIFELYSIKWCKCTISSKIWENCWIQTLYLCHKDASHAWWPTVISRFVQILLLLPDCSRVPFLVL